jgi:hypothetical protein
MGMGKGAAGRELTYRVMFLACAAQVGLGIQKCLELRGFFNTAQQKVGMRAVICAGSARL